MEEAYERHFSRGSDKTWHALFGMSVREAETLFETYLPHTEPRDVLLTLNFLKEYKTHAALSVIWDISESTTISKIWKTIEDLDILLPDVCFSSFLLLF